MGQDKTGVVLRGKSLLQHSIDLFSSLNMDFHLSVNPNQQELINKYSCIVDEYHEKGPLGGITSSLKTLKTDLLVIPVDMPSLTIGLLEELINHSNEEGLVHCFQANKRTEPFPSIWKAESSERLEQFLNQGDLSVQQGIKQISHQIISTKSDDQFENLNYPTQFK